MAEKCSATADRPQIQLRGEGPGPRIWDHGQQPFQLVDAAECLMAQ